MRVNDVNEFSPVFVERRYEASIPEGRLFDRIVRVEALDADCSPQYSQICFYDIITPNVPFAIDNDGETRRSSITAVAIFCSFYTIHFIGSVKSLDSIFASVNKLHVNENHSYTHAHTHMHEKMLRYHYRSNNRGACGCLIPLTGKK